MPEPKRTTLRIKEWYEPATDRLYISMEWKSPTGMVERCYNFRQNDALLGQKILDFTAFYLDYEDLHA